MSQPVRWGLLLGAAVALQNFVFGAAGWHKSATMPIVYLVIAISLNVVAVVLCLRQTAGDAGWLGQLLRGLVLGAVASVLVFASSWLVSAVIFPDYFAEMAAGYREDLSKTDMPPAAIETTVAGVAATSPVRSALEGVAGTFGISLLAAAVSGFWLRRRG